MNVDPAAPGTCAAHPHQLASRHCERCGNYMCERCHDGGVQRACPTCRARFDLAPFPITRERFSLGAVLDVTSQTFKAHWVLLSIGALAYLLVTLAFSALQQVVERVGLPPMATALSLLFVNLVSIVLAWWILLGLIRMSYDALDGRAPDLSALFSQGPKIWKLFAATLVTAIAIGVPVMLLVGGSVAVGIALGEDVGAFLAIGMFALLFVPVIYVSLGLTFVTYELVYDDDCGPIEAIKRSWAISDGYRLPIFGLGLVFALVGVVGFVACCVGVVPAYGFIFLGLAAAHRGLRNGMELPDPTRPVQF